MIFPEDAFITYKQNTILYTENEHFSKGEVMKTEKKRDKTVAGALEKSFCDEEAHDLWHVFVQICM